MARHNEIGKIGEDMAAYWLSNKDFVIIDRNYSRKWGEIDIVARETGGKIHFVEVKSVSYETRIDLDLAVSHETWRPEENVHKSKQDRLKRAIQTWLVEHKHKGDFQIDIIAVWLVSREKYAKISLLENVIFE